MSNENFIDYIKIFCRSGKGGRGAVHFRREKYVPKGGPDGGNGGNGGNVIVRGNKNLWTLLHLRYTKHVFAEDGKDGKGAQCDGESGKDAIIEVPLGTIVKDALTNEVVLEILSHNEEKILLAGGRGGKGNEFFKTAVNQTPRFAQPGEPSREGYFIFELKLLADVGLVGFPNAGKSTLLSVISAAKPKIADYPFTTLYPNLGVVEYRDFKSFVVADIPGIIEGAAEGRGLGLRFLRHIERNSILLFLIPINSDDIKKEYKILLEELRKYNPELLSKRKVVAITKCDLVEDNELKKFKINLGDVPIVYISSVTQKGLVELKDILWQTLNS